uniref:Septin-type G domain-containing protein n=1 Tax=Maylandia zebra TaxID=106582 RepID=A0A3P9DSJ5_9CICH
MHTAVISRSTLISSGSPALYHLKPKKEEFGTLAKMTVGEKIPKKTNKTILLVGETGAGKSTLINALINYTMGVKWEDGVWFQIVEGEKNENQTESQTSDVVVYESFGFEDETLPYSLTIIDTPGFGDTRGIEHDAIVSQQLLDLFRLDDGVHEVHAVGLVMKATDNRLSERLIYIFNSVMSLFGKDVEKNIVALITHSDGRKPKNALKALEVANIKCATNEKNEPAHFLFDNCQDEARAENELEELEHSYDVTQKGIKQLMCFIAELEPQQLDTTVDVLNTRIKLTACFQNLQDRIEKIDLKISEIKKTEEDVKLYEKGLKNDENFTVETDEVYKDQEAVPGGKRWFGYLKGAVTCTVCEETCHYPCTIAKTPGKCEVIQDGNCIVCTKKCPTGKHVKDTWRYVNKTRKVKKTMEILKRTYEVKQEEKKTLLSSLEEEKEKLDEEKNTLSYQHAVRLEQIALKADSASTMVHLDFLIEKMKQKGDTEKVQKLEEMRR